jgi:hypothetical protein
MVRQVNHGFIPQVNFFASSASVGKLAARGESG